MLLQKPKGNEKSCFSSNLLDDGKQGFEKLDEDLVAVLQFKAYVVRLHPRQILNRHVNSIGSFLSTFSIIRIIN